MCFVTLESMMTFYINNSKNLSFIKYEVNIFNFYNTKV